MLPNPDQSNEQDLDNMLQLPSSKYFSASELNNFLNSSNCTNSSSMIHFNIRSLPKNFDQLNEHLSTFDKNIDIIAISETRLNDKSVSNIDLPHYDFFQDNSPTMAGGVALYISNHLKAKHRPDLNFEMQQVESCWVEFDTSKSTSTVIGCVYRHPHANLVEFTKQLEEIIKPTNN